MRTVNDVDAKTFEHLFFDFYRDKNSVYLGIEQISLVEGADRDSFRLLDKNNSAQENYFIDKNNIYYLSRHYLDPDLYIIKNADRVTFDRWETDSKIKKTLRERVGSDNDILMKVDIDLFSY